MSTRRSTALLSALAPVLALLLLAAASSGCCVGHCRELGNLAGCGAANAELTPTPPDLCRMIEPAIEASRPGADLRDGLFAHGAVVATLGGIAYGVHRSFRSEPSTPASARGVPLFTLHATLLI